MINYYCLKNLSPCQVFIGQCPDNGTTNISQKTNAYHGEDNLRVPD